MLHCYPRHVSGINMPIFRRKNCIHAASGIFALCKRLHSTLIESGLCYTIILDMFRALTCPSSGGKIVFTQHLVSSLSVNVCTVHWLRADYVCYTIILDMFGALTCPFSGGKIVFTQHLVSLVGGKVDNSYILTNILVM